MRFYATFRDITGGREADLALAEGATVADLQAALLERWPELRAFFYEPDGRPARRANLFVGGRAARFLPAKEETALVDGQEVDAFPAVAGG